MLSVITLNVVTLSDVACRFIMREEEKSFIALTIKGQFNRVFNGRNLLQ
jgi:hypothetical protein